MAIKLGIQVDGDEHHVWCMLDDADFNRVPWDRGESFVIGTGDRPGAALYAARAELLRVVGDVEVMIDDLLHDRPVEFLPHTGPRPRTITPVRDRWIYVDERGDQWELKVNEFHDARTLPLVVMLLERAK